VAAGSGLTPDAARDLHAKLSPALFELLFVELEFAVHRHTAKIAATSAV
jgi:hypothetical protein